MPSRSTDYGHRYTTTPLDKCQQRPCETMTTWIIANPTAGAGRARACAERAALALQAAGQKIELHYTGQKGDGLPLAAQAVRDGARTLVVCGGDGTIGETLPALVGSTTALGLLPFGTANDFARALGIPRDMAGAVRYLLSARPAPIDLGRMGDRYFSTVAAFGFDAEVSEAMSLGQIPFAGTLGYLLQTLRHLRHFRPPRVVLRGAFGQIEQRIFLVAVGNTRSYGGGMAIAPNADPHDGLFDVCIADAMPIATALSLLPRIFSGHHIAHPSIRIVRTDYLEIDCEEKRLLYADGERGGQTPLTLQTAAAALRILLPSP